MNLHVLHFPFLNFFKKIFSFTMDFGSGCLRGVAEGRRAASTPSPMKYMLSHEGSQLWGAGGRKYFSCFVLAPDTLKLLL